MKIKETISSKPVIEEIGQEELPESVLCRVTYNICNIGERNANNRVYNRDVWDKVLGDKTIREMIENRRLFGQAEHPVETQSDLQLTSHVVHKMWLDEDTNNVYQTLDVLDTPMGRIIDCFLRGRCGVGVSTRADGDLEESEDDQGKFQKVIAESYNYITTDFTADPSTFNVLPQDVKKNVVSSVKAEMENKNATAEERKFATTLLESIQGKETKEWANKDKVKEGTKAKYDGKDFIVESLDEAVGAITLRPDIEGRSVGVEQNSVEFNGYPYIEVTDDGTVIITPVPRPTPGETSPPEPISDGEVETVPDESEPEVEEKCGSKHKKNQNEGMDQMVARKEELLAKKEAGKCTADEQKELDELESKLKEMDVDIEEATLSTEGGVSSKVGQGNVLRKGEEIWVVKDMKDTGITVTQPGEPSTEEHILWDDLESKGFVKIGEKIEESENWPEAIKKSKISRDLYGKSYSDLAEEEAEIVDREYEESGQKKESKGLKEGLESKVNFVLEKAGLILGKHFDWSMGRLTVYEEEDVLPLLNVLNKTREFGPAYSEGKEIKFHSYDPNESKVNEREAWDEKEYEDWPEEEVIPFRMEKQLARTAYIISKLPDAKKFGVGDTVTDEEIGEDFGRQLRGEPMRVDYSLDFDSEKEQQQAEKLSSQIEKELVALVNRLKKDPKFGSVKVKDLDDAFYEILHWGRLGPVESRTRIKAAISRAEKEKALETIEELSDQIDKMKGESSETRMKFKMLMGKMKESLQAYEEVSALRSKLEEKVKDASYLKEENELLGQAVDKLKEKLGESVKNSKEEKVKLSEGHKERMKAVIESNQSRIETIKNDFEEQLVEAKNEGITEGSKKILSDYVDRRLAELGLSIGENTRALLDECESICDVDDILEKTKDIQRRNALHSEGITEVHVRNQRKQIDPEQAKVNAEVGTAFEGMG